MERRPTPLAPKRQLTMRVQIFLLIAAFFLSTATAQDALWEYSLSDQDESSSKDAVPSWKVQGEVELRDIEGPSMILRPIVTERLDELELSPPAASPEQKLQWIPAESRQRAIVDTLVEDLTDRASPKNRNPNPDRVSTRLRSQATTNLIRNERRLRSGNWKPSADR